MAQGAGAAKRSRGGNRTVLQITTPSMTLRQRRVFLGGLVRRGFVLLDDGAATPNGGMVHFAAGDDRALLALCDVLDRGRPRSLVDGILAARAGRADVTVPEDCPEGDVVMFNAVFHPDPDGDGKEPLSERWRAEWAGLVHRFGGSIGHWERNGSVSVATGTLPFSALKRVRRFHPLRSIRCEPLDQTAVLGA